MSERTAEGKTIPAYFLRAQELSRQKRDREQRERERKLACRERVTQRLAAVLGDRNQGGIMDDTHPERLSIQAEDLAEFYDRLDKSRAGTAGQFEFYRWLSKKFPQTATGTWRVGWDNILHPYVEPMPKDTPEALAQEVARLTQELGVAQARLKTVSMDELKSKMLTLMDPGQVITVTKVDPTAPDAGLKLVKPEPAEEPPVSVPKPEPAPDPAPAQ